MTIPETVLVVLAVIVLSGYHLFFFLEIRKSPNRTIVGAARQLRELWVNKIISRGDRILAIQTLRNWVMTSSFLASTSILIAVGLLGFVVSADKLSGIINEINLLGNQGESLLATKFMLLVANFLLAFFNFALALRYYNYLALTITIVENTDDPQTKNLVVKLVNRGADHYTWGMRCFYGAIPLVLWLFGPLWLLVGAIVMAVALYLHDHSILHHK